MKRSVLLLLLVAVGITLAVTAPALAATPPSTNVATSESFTVTLDAADPGTYQMSLMGGLDFSTEGVNRSVPSQNPLYVSNTGTKAFDVYVSADTVPTYMNMYTLSFSDSPGQDQVRWTLTRTPNAGMDTSVSESYAANFGTINPGDGMTLYSTVQMGTGLTYAGQYTWNATVYAEPTS